MYPRHIFKRGKLILFLSKSPRITRRVDSVNIQESTIGENIPSMTQSSERGFQLFNAFLVAKFSQLFITFATENEGKSLLYVLPYIFQLGFP